MNDYKALYKYLFDVLFYLASFLIAFRTVILYSKINSSMIVSVIAAIVLLILFLNIISGRYRIGELFLSLVLLCFCVLIYSKSGSIIPMYSVLFLIASKRKKMRQIINSHFLGMFFGVGIVVISAIGGRIPIVIVDGGIALGFGNPNTLSFYITVMLLYWVYLRYEKISFFEILVLFIISTSINLLTKSRTGLLLAFIILYFVFITKSSIKMKIKLIKYSEDICIFILLFCIAGIILVNINPVFGKINSILSGRFTFAQIYIGIYGIHPFGVNIDDARTYGFGNIVLDNGYARLLVNYGLFIVIYLGSFLRLLKYNKRNLKDVRVSIVIIAIFIGLVTETLWISINTNICICLCSLVLFQKSYNLKQLTRSL